MVMLPSFSCCCRATPPSTQKTTRIAPTTALLMKMHCCFYVALCLCYSLLISCCFSDWTPLHGAAYDGRVDACRALVSAKADVAARTKCNFIVHAPPCENGTTPLKVAIDRKKSDVIAFLRSVGAPE